LVVLATGFYSAALVAGSLSLLLQEYRWHIPEGEVVAVETKSNFGYRFTLADGTEGSVPGWILRKARGEAPLVPGDRIAKPKHSFTYRLNNRAVTDFQSVHGPPRATHRRAPPSSRRYQEEPEGPTRIARTSRTR
jgi:hypothetical protein